MATIGSCIQARLCSFFRNKIIRLNYYIHKLLHTSDSEQPEVSDTDCFRFVHQQVKWRKQSWPLPRRSLMRLNVIWCGNQWLWCHIADWSSRHLVNGCNLADITWSATRRKYRFTSTFTFSEPPYVSLHYFYPSYNPALHDNYSALSSPLYSKIASQSSTKVLHQKAYK